MSWASGWRLRFTPRHQVPEEDRMRELTIEDIDELTLGATLLGAGGGGDPYIARLMVRQAIEDFGPVKVVAATDLPPDGRVKPVAIMPIEAGGMNTLIPLAVATELGLPVVDADGMRRAFPQIEMTVLTLGGIPASPMSIADEKGNLVVCETTNNQVAERFARGTVIMLGMANA